MINKGVTYEMSKKRLLDMVLAIEALLCVLFAVWWKDKQDVSIYKIIELPVELIGRGLRYLSLSDAVGNVIAIILYVLLCAMPLAVAAYLVIKKKAKFEDWLLLLISVFLFWGIYVFINPGKIADIHGAIINASMYKSAIVTTILSVTVLFIVIKTIKALDRMREHGLVKALKTACIISLIFIVVYVCFAGFSSLLDNIQKALSNNQYIENTMIILVLRFITEQIPNVCIFIIIHRMVNLTGLFHDGFITQNVLNNINNISDMCKKSIIVILLSGMLMNIIQIIMTTKISIANYHVYIPVFSVLAIIVLLIITKIISESCRIKEDNDLFI